MTGLGAILAELKTERARLDRAIEALSGVAGAAGKNNNRRGRRKLSAAARQRIAAAQKASWAKFKAKKSA